MNWEREETLTVKFEYKYEHWEEETIQMKLRKITVSSFLFGNLMLRLNNYNWKPFQKCGKIDWEANHEVENIIDVKYS